MKREIERGEQELREGKGGIERLKDGNKKGGKRQRLKEGSRKGGEKLGREIERAEQEFKGERD